MDLGLRGRVAIVTGGSEGIGKAAAVRLAAEGARVAIAARRPDVLERTAEDIRKETEGEVMPVPTDVMKPEQVRRLVQAVVSRWGRVDILVNNAGTSAAMPFESAGDEAWAADLDLKLYGAIRCCREVLPHMKERGWGRIINVTAIGGRAPGARSAPTTVSRAAGIALTKVLSKEYAEHGILVNTVCIGLVKAGQHEHRYEQLKRENPGLTLEAFYRQIGATVPLGRVGEAREAGDVIAFLASERASYLTGIAVNIDGGTSPVI
ncbi:MAG: SDR family oxidoreductase [Dehalococcoidia bacterium]|nr:SDR family oxidoreductase [Dehalococcoidia bacterium]